MLLLTVVAHSKLPNTVSWQIGRPIVPSACCRSSKRAAPTIDLVAPPKAGDLGGLAVVSGSTALATADITLTATGLNVVFSGLTPGIVEMNTSLTNLRLPTSCPTVSANVTLTADSVSTTAPLTVTGCSSLPYAPAVTASVTKDAKDSGAAIVLGITQADGATLKTAGTQSLTATDTTTS